ncbi:MAG: DNA repair protein RecO [Candidatus Zophobacter franzmannii]|nr:DNA repair protein RecO [Candidatus Zophobacter franzmannii]
MQESRHFSSNCIVLRVTDYSESSYILLLLSETHGLISAIAKGAKKLNSKYFSVFGLLNEFDGEFTRSAGSELLTITNANLIKSHLPGLKYSIVQLLSAGAELISQSIFEEEEADKYYRLLHGYLTYLPTVSNNPVLIFWRFIYSYLKLVGIKLEITTCHQCSSYMGMILNYSIRNGCFFCSSCLKKESISADLSGSASIVILAGVSAEIVHKLPSIGNHMSDFTITKTTFELINKVFLNYLRYHLLPNLHLNSLKGFII